MSFLLAVDEDLELDPTHSLPVDIMWAGDYLVNLSAFAATAATAKS